MLDPFDKRQQPIPLDQEQFDRLATTLGQMNVLRAYALNLLQGDQLMLRSAAIELVTTIDQRQKLIALHPELPDEMKQAMLQEVLVSFQRNAALTAYLHETGVSLMQREAEHQLEPPKPKPSFWGEFMKGLTGAGDENTGHENASSNGNGKKHFWEN